MSASNLATAATKVASLVAKGVAGVAALAAAYDIGKTVLDQSKVTSGSNIYNDNNLTFFPYDLPKVNGQTFCLTMQFYSYSRPSILVAPTLIPIGMIGLPLPSDMVDKMAMSYSEVDSSAMVGAALESASLSSAGAIQALAHASAGLGVDAFNNIASAAGQANILPKLLQFSGVAQNPFLSMLFNAPTFKRHTFTYTFIPEQQQDTEILNYILNKLRYHMHPSINASTGGLLLGYPDMVKITLLPQGYLYDFQYAVIEGMSISYAPGNTPAFTTKNAPNAIRLTLNLLEIEYWTKESFGSPNSGLINLPGQTPYMSAA